MARKSNSYAFTYTPNVPESEIQLAQLKAEVAELNMNHPVKLRVFLRGRLGKNNPLRAIKYRNNYHNNIAKADAKHFDVYIYERR